MSKTTIAFLAILGLALTVRLVLALSWDGYWGVDGGASLLNVNYVLGDEPTNAGFPKPPLAPGFTLAPFVLALGVDVGYKVWSALFAILPLIPVFLLTRKYVGAWAAVIATLFASVDWFWGEMFVTGAHPLVAFALIGMAWYSIGEKAEEKDNKNWSIHDFIIIASIGLVPWVNQTAAGLAVLVLPAFFFALCWFKRDWLIRVMVPCIWASFLALGALPWYMQTLPGSAILTYDGPIIYWGWGVNTVQSLLIALPLGIFAVWKGNHPVIKSLGVVLLTLAVLLPWLSFDEVLINPPYRARYLLALVFYPVMAWVVINFWLPNVQAWLTLKNGSLREVSVIEPSFRGKGGDRVTVSLIILAMLGTFVYMSSVFIYVVEAQAATSAMVTPETVKALEIVKYEQETNPQPETSVATNSFTLSLWVAGLLKVKSPFLTTAPPPPFYVSSDILLRCSFGWVTDCNGGDSASTLGVRYLLVEERFPYYNQFAPGNYLAPENQWEVTANAEWLELVFSEGTTRLYEIK